MRPRPACFALLGLLLVPAWPDGSARADIIHLKNGGKIVADSWEDRGDALIVVQGGGRITVPRADVLRIETTPPVKPPSDSAPQAGATAPSGAVTKGGIDAMTDDEIAGAIAVLKRRIDDYPLAREEN